MIHFKKIKIVLLFFFLVSACSSIPRNTSNSCEIFEERYLWYKHTKSSYETWGAPIHIQLAFVKKESDFNWLAKPPREKLFNIISVHDDEIMADFVLKKQNSEYYNHTTIWLNRFTGLMDYKIQQYKRNNQGSIENLRTYDLIKFNCKPKKKMI